MIFVKAVLCKSFDEIEGLLTYGQLPDHPMNQKIYESSRSLKFLKISTRWNIHDYELQPADVL